jgi:hypothetical protein
MSALANRVIRREDPAPRGRPDLRAPSRPSRAPRETPIRTDEAGTEPGVEESGVKESGPVGSNTDHSLRRFPGSSQIGARS